MRNKANRVISNLIGVSLLALLLWQILSMFREADWEIKTGEVKIATKIISDLAHNNNPYGTDWLYNKELPPPVYYESGFFHVLPSVLLLKLFPITVYQAAAFVHCCYVLIALSLMFLVVRRLSGNLCLSIFSSVAYFYCLNAYMCTNQRPDTLCSLCCVLILYLLLLDKDIELTSLNGSKILYVPLGKRKKWLYVREWVVAFLCALLIFLKIHYASIIFALFFYYLKRKRIIPILIKGSIFLVLFIGICNYFFPTFFSTFVVRVIEMLKQNSADQSSYMEMWGKWKELFLIFPVLFIVICTGVFKIKSFGLNEIGTFMAIHVVFNFFSLCFMGKWPGNGIIYHEVMLMPIMIPASIWLFSCWCNKIGDKTIYLGTILLIIISILFWGRSEGIPNADFSQNEGAKEVRKRQIEELDQYKSEHMLLAPYYSFYAFQKDMYQWNYGDQIYIPYNIGTSPRWNFLFPYTNLYRDRCREYCMYMLGLIRNKEYSLIITDNTFILGLKLGYEQDFETAIEDNYQVIKDETGFKYYVPKKETPVKISQ